MTIVIRCAKGAGMDDLWAVELEAQAFGLCFRRTRWLFVASVGGAGNWVLQKQVKFS
jgi:hypothetical protein